MSDTVYDDERPSRQQAYPVHVRRSTSSYTMVSVVVLLALLIAESAESRSIHERSDDAPMEIDPLARGESEHSESEHTYAPEHSDRR